MNRTPTALFLVACAVGVLFCAGAAAQVHEDGTGWRPDPAVVERAAALYSGPDPKKQEEAYNQAYFEFYHSTPDNAVADWQIAKRMNALYSGDDPKKQRAAYRQAYREVWKKNPPKNAPIPDVHLWIDPVSAQEKERLESGLDKPPAHSKIGSK
ncbi:hypothetical protein SAMN05444156_1304 [Verrucomicrobium sp. GAS474]|uniref:hypothetical protein n=1 Tax=Verrucomicrobium sp. GAS474 TaxID=1882831 RepID=UPI00087ACDC2|nr:hypothetical protein [Verrucomicrobium sp. GAS474]SDT99224.1 hypothetical protein SAMN05444156_1304 [Verrucomicrobium sp. GAS474]